MFFLKSGAQRLSVSMHDSALPGADWSTQKRRRQVQLALAFNYSSRAGEAVNQAVGMYSDNIVEIFPQPGSPRQDPAASADILVVDH